MGTTSSTQVMADLCACFERAVDRRRAIKDTRVHWFVDCCVSPSSEESASGSSFRIAAVLEEGRGEYVSISSTSVIFPGPRNLRASPSKAKKKNVNCSLVKLPRRFEISSPTETPQEGFGVENPKFGAALVRQQSRGTSRRSKRDQCAAPVFQKGLF